MRCTKGRNRQVRHNLGIVLCESLVNTKLRYVQKSVEISGTQMMQLVEAEGRITLLQRVSVRIADTEMNVPNGEYRTKSLVYGVDLLL